MRNFILLPPALYYLFLVFVCKGNKFICRTQIILLKSLCFYLLLTFINKYIYILNTILQIKVLPHLIIYRAIIRGSRGGCPPWCPRWLVVLVLAGVLAGGVLVASWLEVSSWWLVSVECSSLVAGGASLVVLVVAGGVLPGASLVVLVVAGGVLPGVRPHIHSRTRRRGHARALQCGGALACESKLQGKFAGCDSSNYQLFRYSFWGSFYRLIYKLKY